MTESRDYRIEFDPRAGREFRKLDGVVRRRIRRQILALAESPRPPGCRKLAGHDQLWRIRVGDYRVIYAIDDATVLVLVLRVAHRREAYRGDPS